MNYNEFKEHVIRMVERRVPKDKHVSISRIYKNNYSLEALCISGDDGNKPTPAIYLIYHYNDYRDGKSIDECVEDILDIYEHFKDANPFDIRQFDDYCNVKDQIVCRLVNAERNEKILEDCPHVRILDLAILFYCVFRDDGEWAGIRINNGIMDGWDIDMDVLKKDAMENTLRILGINALNIVDLMAGNGYDKKIEKKPKDCSMEKFKEELEDRARFWEDDNPEAVVVSNCRCFMGATSIIFPEVLDACAEAFGRNFYVIPSSVHEVIMLPTNDELKKDNLDRMVVEVNDQINESEVLSDHAYIYLKEERRLAM